jgi:hypothetical protein
VTSLRTARPRGKGSNGRFYYPYLSAVNGPDGRLSSAGATGYNARAKILFDALNAEAAVHLDSNAKISVMSKVGAITEHVTSVRNDGRMDRQERRENNLPSVWASAALA